MPAGEQVTHRCDQSGRLAKIETQIGNLGAADDRHANALQEVTASIKLAQKERRVDHKELVTKLDGFILDHENRVTTVEESTKSAHHRVDAIKSILQWGAGILVTVGLAVAGYLVVR